MSQAVLLNRETFEEDTEFPRLLSEHANLAAHAASQGSETYQDPVNQKERRVQAVRVWNNQTNGFKEVPGAWVNHEGLVWEVWINPTPTSAGSKYFRARAFHPLMLTLDKKKRMNDPAVVANSLIFHNKVDGKDKYSLVLRPAAESGKVEMARKLFEAGVDMQTLLSAEPTLTKGDITGNYEQSRRGGRSSDFDLG